ncbi:MAG TPA: hypothetical protein VK893_03655 [Pyrinomonadaceae bacterium]|nr:hypothetical protein [Pyrinomonadaceae bacterium]
MEAVTGVFQTRKDAENAINELRKAGLADNRIGLITPGADGDELEAGLPVTDTERPGMGRAMGAAVGGAMGAAGGATLGLAVATFAIPGVGPVLAFGMVGAALLGAAGATAGAAVGDTIEEELGEGVPREDIYLYEDSLRHGHSIVIAYTENDDQSDRAEETLERTGAMDLDELRENWWNELRDGERSHYHSDFDPHEASYRRGFQADLHPQRRGKAYTDVEQELRTAYTGSELDTAFREGYERGLAHHQSRISETRNA